MKARLTTLALALAIGSAVTVGITVADEPKKPATAPAPAAKTTPKRIVKSDDEWKELLTPEQFRITRQAGTERAYGEAYDVFKKQGEGIYYCVCCSAELFRSKTKFDSRCGWPSFYDPSKAKNVKTKIDYKIGYARTEVLCARCDAHLGHVFEGEGFDTPTDKRYCINAVAMKFVPEGGKPPEPPATDADENAETEPAKKEPTGDDK